MEKTKQQVGQYQLGWEAGYAARQREEEIKRAQELDTMAEDMMLQEACFCGSCGDKVQCEHKKKEDKHVISMCGKCAV